MHSPTLHLRPYESTDWPHLCELHDLARKDELRASGLIDAFIPLEQAAANEGLFDGVVTVAIAGGVARGFSATLGRELTWLYVHPEWYRKGIGRALLHHAAAANDGGLSAEVLVGNDAALAFYLAEGFRVIRRADGKLNGNERFAASAYVLQWGGYAPR